MKVSSIVIDMDDGTTLTLTYENAKGLYAVLKDMFEEKTQPLVPIPYYPGLGVGVQPGTQPTAYPDTYIRTGTPPTVRYPSTYAT
jgi:hypothetical protein